MWNNKAHTHIFMLDCAKLLRLFGSYEDENTWENAEIASVI